MGAPVTPLSPLNAEYGDLIEFDSYESAMENSNRLETDVWQTRQLSGS
jgi:hypothetical protein